MTRIRDFIIVVLLGLAGFACTWFRWEVSLFFNVDFMVGSVFVMLAILRYGAWAGVLAGAITWSGTFWLYHHPYAFVVFGGEAVFVGAMTSRRRDHVILFDALYWLCIGAPLIWLLYMRVMGMQTESALLFMSKQLINSTCNALVASIGYLAYRTLRRLPTARPRFESLVFTTMLTIVLVPSIAFLVVAMRDKMEDNQAQMVDLATYASTITQNSVGQWLSENTHSLEQAASVIGDPGRASAEEVQRHLESVKLASPWFSQMGVFVLPYRSIAYTPTVDPQGRSTIGRNLTGQPYMDIVRQTARPYVSDPMMRAIGPAKPAVLVLAPLFGRDQAVVGFCSGVLEPDYLKGLLKRYSAQLSIALTLVDRNGLVVSSTHDDIATMSAFTRLGGGESRPIGANVTHWIPPLRPGESPLVRWWRSTFVLRSERNANLPWTIVVEVPAEAFMREIVTTSTLYTTILAVFVFGVVLASQLLSRRLTRPVVHLQGLTRTFQHRIGRDRQDTDWPTSNIREVQDLVDNVQSMEHTMQSALNEVTELNEHLEERVALRARQLAESERRFRDVLESVQLFAVQIDSAGIVTFCNDHLLAVLGWMQDGLVGRNWFETCLPADAAAAVMPVFRSAVSARASFPGHFENEVITRAGDRRLVAWNNVTMRDATGAILGTTSLGIDVTDAREAEAALKASEEQFASIFKNAPLLISLADASDGCYVDVNDTFLDMTGFSREEVLGRSGVDIGLYDQAERAKLVDALSQRQRLIRYDLTLHAKDGRALACHYWGEVLTIGGRRVLLSMAEDVTERRASQADRARLEEQLNQALKMEAIGRLAGGVAHDFNNLLTVILGGCDLMLDNHEYPGAIRTDVTEIRNAAQRAASLTQQLLAFSRKQVLQMQVLDVRDVLIDVERMIGRILGEDIDLQVMPGTAAARIKADPGQVQQVIMNLAINARDAMPQGGKLTIEAGVVTCDQEFADSHHGMVPGPHVLLAVSDTGIGMDPATRSHLFEPFFTTKKMGKGTGLGLATVHGIVNQIGGHITVYSEIDHGTTFKIYFPMTDAAATRAADLAAGAAGGRASERILLVEDSPDVRPLVARMLRSFGYDVTEAASGFDALSLCGGDHPAFDVVLTDVVMPGMSGRELGNRIVDVCPAIKVIYMSGYTENAIVHHGVLDEGLHFIQKPFTPADLNAKIRALVDRPR